MAQRKAMIITIGGVLVVLGTVRAASGSALAVVVIFAGLVLVAVGVDRRS